VVNAYAAERLALTKELMLRTLASATHTYSRINLRISLRIGQAYIT
jgi:hypothetical protein